MDKVLPAAGHLEHITADREGYLLGIIIIQNQPHGQALNTFIHDSFLRHDKAPVDKRLFIVDGTDLITFGKLIPLINEAMIGRYDEAVCIGIR